MWCEIPVPYMIVLVFSILVVPSVHGQAKEKQREQIGEVIGKPVFRDQIDGGRSLADEVHRLFSQPAGRKYFDQHKKEIEPTEEEIAFTAAYFDRNHKKENQDKEGVYRRELEAIEKKLKQSNLTKEEERKLSLEKALLKVKLEPPGRFFAEFMLNNWKIHKHLYDNFGGGRIQWQQVGLQAFDASKKFQEAMEKNGDFKITDPALRKALYAYWDNESHLITDTERIRKEFLEAEWIPPQLKSKPITKPR